MVLAELDGMLHGLGSPATGERVRVRLDAHGLTIVYPGGRSRGVPSGLLRSRVGGWRGQALLLEWEEDGEPATLALNDEPALARLAKPPAGRTTGQLPSGLQPHLQAWARAQRRQQRQRRAALALGTVLVLAVAALAVALLLRAGKLTDLAVGRIPMGIEQEIGELALQQATLGARELPPGLATAAVDTIMRRLLPHVAAPYTFRWKVIESEQVNAFAVPGGGIVVFSGLLRQAGNAEEAAGVLAHEIQHVVHRHSLRALVQSLGLAAVLDVLVGRGGQLAGNIASVAHQLGRLQFSRTQEEQADAGAVRLLAQAEIRADGIAAFFRRLDRESGATVPALLSTHPDSGDRAGRVAAMAAALPIPPPLPLDWEAVRASLRAAP